MKKYGWGLLLILCLVACGQQGPLTLPEPKSEAHVDSV